MFFYRYAAPVLGLLLLSNTALAQDGPPPLTPTQAVDEALTHSPRVAAADAGIRSAEGGLAQADTSPNPSLGIEGENIGGNGPYNGFDSAELTYGLSQQIELGGKRSAREAAAKKQITIAELDATITRLDLARDVKQAFASAVAAQESLRLAEDALAIAREELKSVARRVAEAASPLIQKSKAEVTLATATFNVEQARQELSVARMQLATLLGRSQLTERLDTSSFFAVEETAAPQADAIERTPDMLRLRLHEDRAKALLDIEQAGAIPDPVVSLGVRQLRQTNDHAFVVGVSIPLPVMHSNSGNIASASAEVTRTASDQQTARLGLLQRYAAAISARRTAYVKATSYKTTVLPAAEQAFALSRQGYGAGKFQYLEVLDAQRTLFDARAQYVGALRDYHIRNAELERLGTPYESATKTDGAPDAKK
ncbi:MAG: TolC family protein [Pseudomonadota bacterium]